MGGNGIKCGVVSPSPIPTADQQTASDVLFLGEFKHSLDPKSRVTVPSNWRDQLANEKGLAVVPGMSRKCLVMMPARDMKRRVFAAIQTKGITDERSRQVASSLGAQSAMVEWDSAGRVRVPDNLLKVADLKDDVVLIGALDVIELWSPANWEAFQKSTGPEALGAAAKEINF